MAIREYDINMNIFNDMPVTFHGNEVGHVISVKDGCVHMCTDVPYVQSLLSSNASFSLEVGKGKHEKIQ